VQYSLMLYQTDAQFAARTDPARRDAVAAAFGRYVGALKDAGVLLTTLGIEPPDTVATVRRGNSASNVQKGPFTHTKEQLGGLCVIEAPDLEAATIWAERAPFDHCAVVEVRPTRVVPNN